LCVAAISKEEAEDSSTRNSKLPYNGYSDEFLDRLEPNGNIPTHKDMRYGKDVFIGTSVLLGASQDD
jgi:hypothetical protein